MNDDKMETVSFCNETGDDYSYDDEVLCAAKKTFGIRYFFPWQRIVIANILDSVILKKEDISEYDDIPSYSRQIVILPTGSGKSLCFLAPALVLSRPTLVIYPLLALISDQKRRMDEAGIKNVVFRGGMTDSEYNENFRQIENGAKIILANPEILQNKYLLNRLLTLDIAHIAIDEAHCTSEWGDTFRPAYLSLGDIIRKINPSAVTAFTATASPYVLSRISEILFDGSAHIVRSGSDRPNIHYRVINTYAKKRTAFKLAFTEKKPLLIFCGTRLASEELSKEISAFCGDKNVRFYHAGMDKAERKKVEEWFYSKTDAVLCCTCAFGMGVDKKDIRTVIHLEPSPTVEAYVQETGRAGRDGLSCNAVLLWSFNDHIKAEKIPDTDRRKVMQKFAESKICRRQILLDALGGEQTSCGGCDVCDGKSEPEFAKDAETVLNLVRKSPSRFTQNELNHLAVEELNKTSADNFPVYIYEHNDAQEIISQLKKRNLIYLRKFPFKGLIAPVKKIQDVYPDP